MQLKSGRGGNAEAEPKQRVDHTGGDRDGDGRQDDSQGGGKRQDGRAERRSREKPQEARRNP